MSAQEDPLDIYDTALSSLFAVPPIAITTTSLHPYYTYTPPGADPKAIEIRIPQPPSSVYTSLQANHLWPAALYLADLISEGQVDVKNKTVAELGAGTGLPAIVACRDGHARSVLSTDWDAKEILDIIRSNFERNCRSEEHRWKVAGHRWGSECVPLLIEGKQFDTLLMADVIWSTSTHESLLNSIFGLLRPGGIAYLTAGLHTGRGPLTRFIATSRSRGALIEIVQMVKWSAERRWVPYETAYQGLEEERGVVVYLILQV